MDRLPRLFEQCKSWTGVVSVAIYMESDTFFEFNKNRIIDIHSSIEQLGKCRLDIHLFFENSVEKDLLYPINALRYFHIV